MDLVRAFTDAGLKQGVTINIQGTYKEPLFQAKQIGELLGMTNIRKTLADFDDDEVHVTTSYTSGVAREATFLTEVGLYRLLGMSRMPLARPFQKWVAKVVKEIRLNGKYELEKQLESQRAITAAKEAELEAKEAELQAFKSKTYEELPRLDKNYIFKDASQLSTDHHKLGKAIDEGKREAQLNTSLSDGGKMIFVRPSTNGKLVEDIAKHALKRYHVAREHYNCRVEHTADVFDIAGTVVDVLASSYEHIERKALLQVVIGELEELLCTSETADDEPCSPQSSPVHQDSLDTFLQRSVKQTGNKGDVLRRRDLYVAYIAYCHANEQAPLAHKVFKVDVVRRLGPPQDKSNQLSNFWRGLKLIKNGSTSVCIARQD